MGNSGGSKPYTPPPPTPMPVEDSIKARHEAAALAAERMSGASRAANDLNGRDNSDVITRGDIAKADSFSPQPRPRGPKGGRRAPGTQMGSALNASAVLTG